SQRWDITGSDEQATIRRQQGHFAIAAEAHGLTETARLLAGTGVPNAYRAVTSRQQFFTVGQKGDEAGVSRLPPAQRAHPRHLVLRQGVAIIIGAHPLRFPLRRFAADRFGREEGEDDKQPAEAAKANEQRHGLAPADGLGRLVTAILFVFPSFFVSSIPA